MRAQPLLSAIAAFCLTATIGAQSTTTTIVGCLVQGRPGLDGKLADAEEFFVRTPTIKLPPGASVAVGSPGTASTATSAGTPVEDSFYRVTTLGPEQLRPHLGHRVELQGRLADNTPGVESTRATTTVDKEGRATTAVETRIAVAGVLHATALKMVSVSCEPKD